MFLSLAMTWGLSRKVSIMLLTVVVLQQGRPAKGASVPISAKTGTAEAT